MGAFGGFLSGLAGGVQNQKDKNQQNGGLGLGLGSTIQAPKNSMPSANTPVATPVAATTPQLSQNGNTLPAGLQARQAPPSAQSAGQPATGAIPQINTQQQSTGFHGIVPMAMGYYQNHQAGVRDAAAQQHINSLHDPNITPEQRQYHQSSLQQIYAGQPQVLQQLGLHPQQGGYSVPNVVAPGGTQ